MKTINQLSTKGTTMRQQMLDRTANYSKPYSTHLAIALQAQKAADFILNRTFDKPQN